METGTATFDVQLESKGEADIEAAINEWLALRGALELERPKARRVNAKLPLAQGDPGHRASATSTLQFSIRRASGLPHLTVRVELPLRPKAKVAETAKEEHRKEAHRLLSSLWTQLGEQPSAERMVVFPAWSPSEPFSPGAWLGEPPLARRAILLGLLMVVAGSAAYAALRAAGTGNGYLALSGSVLALSLLVGGGLFVALGTRWRWSERAARGGRAR